MSRRLMLIAAGLLLGRGAFAMCYEVYTGDHPGRSGSSGAATASGSR